MSHPSPFKGVKRGPRPAGWVNPRKGKPALDRRRPAEERFWEKVAKADSAGCWLWTGTIVKDGYGHFLYEGRMQPAHRVVLMLGGVEIPPGMFIDHMCRTPACVNPAHLRIVTPGVNTLENNDNPWAINAAKTHCTPKGHPLTGDNVVWLQVPGKSRASRRPTRICAACYPHMRNSRYRVDPPAEGHTENSLSDGPEA